MWRLVKYLTNRDRLAVLAWLTFNVLIGASYWLSVQYSDIIMLCVSILMIYCYIHQPKWRYYPYVKWVIIATLLAIGAVVKPQVVVAAIAIIIIAALNANYRRGNLKPLAVKGALFTSVSMIVLVTTGLVSRVVLD